MEASLAEIGYLKAIDRLSTGGEKVSTNAIAQEFHVAPASVTDMVQKLAEKEFVRYEKYKGVALLPTGRKFVLKAKEQDEIWLRFLKEKLSFPTPQIEDALKEFRKIQSPVIIQQLKNYLEEKKIRLSNEESVDNINISKPFHLETKDIKKTLLDSYKGQTVRLIGITETDQSIIDILDFLKIPLGIPIQILNKFSYDESLLVQYLDIQQLITRKLAEKLLVVND